MKIYWSEGADCLIVFDECINGNGQKGLWELISSFLFYFSVFSDNPETCHTAVIREVLFHFQT